MNLFKKIIFSLCISTVFCTTGFAAASNQDVYQLKNSSTSGSVKGTQPDKYHAPSHPSYQNYQKRPSSHTTSSQHPSNPRKPNPSAYPPQKFGPSGGGGTGY